MIERRSFLRQLVGRDEPSGPEATRIRLRELWTLTDPVMAELKPMLVSGVALVRRGDRLCARHAGVRVVDICGLREPGAAVVGRFNGHATLGAIAADLGEERTWPHERAFALARELFLQLVAHRVSVPANAPVERRVVQSVSR